MKSEFDYAFPNFALLCHLILVEILIRHQDLEKADKDSL